MKKTTKNDQLTLQGIFISLFYADPNGDPAKPFAFLRTYFPDISPPEFKALFDGATAWLIKHQIINEKGEMICKH